MTNGNGGSDHQCASGKVHEIVNYSPAIILYPSLVTPEILIADEFFQILLLGKKGKPLTADNVNWQLKIGEGLDAQKKFVYRPLFKENAKDYITGHFDKPIDLTADAIQTNTKVMGLVDKRALKLFKDNGYDQLYNVNIANSFIRKEGVYNLMWIHWKGEATGTGATGRLNKVLGGKCTPNELQDQLIQKVLKKINGPNIVDKGTHCFEMLADDVNIASVDLMNPIQSYHPVFYYKYIEAANFAHMADVHISSRQNLLEKSKARVIEYSAAGSGGSKAEADKDVSPMIGPMLNSCSRNIKELFDRFGGDGSVHALVISGDLIDFIKSLYIGLIKDFGNIEPTVKEIWGQVSLKGSWNQRYQDFVDYISIYTLVLYFYRKHKKPMFVVSGNHDCYHKPYGISPRALGSKANEGIPADHNLTIYEACLAFGDSYGKIMGPVIGNLIGKGNFKKDKFEWFYSVLTPFSDFVIDFPGQVLVGFAWGEQEDLLDPPGMDQGFGHLPRSDDAVTGKQLGLLKTALKAKKKVIVTSHFTFVSYKEKIGFNTTKEGDVEFDSFWDAGDHDQGTFETNRKPIYEQYFAKKRNILCTLSGHSHRRGLYSILRADYRFDNSVKTAVMDFADLGKDASKPVRPAVVVSDSAGPIPRRNKAGEMRAWGSDNPSGTKVIFNSDGSLQRLEPVRALGRPCPEPASLTTAKPRFAVAADYIDIVDKKDVIRKFETQEFEIKSEKKNIVKYKFTFWMSSIIWDAAWLKRICLYCYAVDGEWKKIELKYEKGNDSWNLEDSADVKTFRKFFATQDERAIFCSVKFAQRSQLVAQYDFGSWWNFEIQIKPDKSGGFPIFGSPKRKKYIIKRDKKRAELPSFGWRKKFDKYK